MGGFLVRERYKPFCDIYEIKDVLSECEAEIKDMGVIIQIALKDLCCVENELELSIQPHQYNKWLSGVVPSSWEVRFTRNLCIAMKEWY